MEKIIIVGGVAGGMSAATRLRRLKEDAEIIVIDKGPYVSFANCGLPYHLSGEIPHRESLLVQTPQALKDRFNLDVRVSSLVSKIDRQAKTVTIEGPQGTYQEKYDTLILSPGAQPFVPAIPGLDQATNVYQLRNIPDLDRIMAAMQSSDQEKKGQATVIGAGFIGLEMAESLVKAGYQVRIIELAPHVLPPLDQEMAAFIQAELEANGLEVYTNQALTAFEDQGKTLILQDGTRLSSDLTILSVGVRPDTAFVGQAGIELGHNGGILVDENYRTNDPSIYAVGDAILVKQVQTQALQMIALANPANRQGRQVADIIAGLKSVNKGSLGTAIVRVFNLTAAATGLSERLANQYFQDIQVVHTSGKDHAGYFPGAQAIHMKLIFSKTDGKIYGAQAVGAQGVDKRIDVLATAIKAGLTVYDLPELELTYAPPFGSAKDPVNMIGYADMNLLDQHSESIQWYQVADMQAAGYQLLDVRQANEVQNGRLQGAQHIPLDQLRDQLDQLDPKLPYIVYCHSGQRSYIAERILKQKGFQVKNLDGAYLLYQQVYPERIIHD
ncbi:TPA: FAD-dependent oxidoreductase [Streptococcus suis]